jgi:hypothetical protein
MPRYVQKALNDGYTIRHKGLLCWTALPSVALQPTIRLLFVDMEAAFSYVVWAMRTTKRDYGMSQICPWPLDTLEYDGLCSHPSLREGVSSDFDLTPEQLEATVAELKQRRTDLTAEANSDYHKRQLDTNADDHRARKVVKQPAYASNHPEKIYAIGKNYATKARENKTYYCEVCDLACSKNSEVLIHNKTKKHLRNAAAHSTSKLD